MPVRDDDTIEIYGDTEALDLMSDINEMLAEHGLVFEDVSEDGWDHVQYKLQSLETEESESED